jgi:hypothetical protein
VRCYCYAAETVNVSCPSLSRSYPDLFYLKGEAHAGFSLPCWVLVQVVFVKESNQLIRPAAK